MSEETTPHHIPVVRGEDPRPNPWDEALSLSRSVDELSELRQSDEDGSLMELLQRWRQREAIEKDDDGEPSSG